MSDISIFERTNLPAWLVRSAPMGTHAAHPFRRIKTTLVAKRATSIKIGLRVKIGRRWKRRRLPHPPPEQRKQPLPVPLGCISVVRGPLREGEAVFGARVDFDFGVDAAFAQ